MTYKSSKQRDLVQEYMSGISTHVSAEEIFENINADKSRISLATVYRNLKILEDLKIIKKIALPKDGFVYDKTCDPHYHFYCVKCGTLYDLDTIYKVDLDGEVEDHYMIDSIDTHDITFQGICKNCK